MDLYLDPALDTAVDPAVAAASAALADKLARSSRSGYVRVSTEADPVVGGQIGQAIRPLAAVVTHPGSPPKVTLGLNARSADAVLKILRDLAR